MFLRCVEISQENDILDVWFDSGSSNLAGFEGKNGPLTSYLEGPDQYRGCFIVSLLVADRCGRHAAPYRSVVTHGWTLDEQGRPCRSHSAIPSSPRNLYKWEPIYSPSGSRR